jgi:hypothetical protein
MNLNRLLLLAAAATIVSCSTSPKVAPAIPQDNEIEAKVENGVLTINVFKVKTLPTKEYSINID